MMDFEDIFDFSKIFKRLRGVHKPKLFNYTS